MDDLDLECVKSFVVLAEERHFGRAAARLHVTAPALSRRVQKLERQLGVLLIERDHAGTSRPTPAGHRFAAAAAGLLLHAQHVRSAALGRSAMRLPAGFPPVSTTTAPT